MSVAAPLPVVDVLNHPQDQHETAGVTQDSALASAPEHQSIPALNDLLQRYQASRAGQSALSEEDQQKAAELLARLRRDPDQISRMLAQRERAPPRWPMVNPPGSKSSEVNSENTSTGGRSSDVEGVVVSPEAQTRREQESSSTYGSVSTENSSGAESLLDDSAKDGKKRAEEQAVSHTDDASTDMNHKFKGYQPSAPRPAAENRMTLEDLRRLQGQSSGDSATAHGAQTDQGGVVRFQPPASTAQTEMTGNEALSTVPAGQSSEDDQTVVKKGLKRRSIDGFHRLSDRAKRLMTSSTDNVKTSGNSTMPSETYTETPIDYKALLGAKDAEKSTLTEQLGSANQLILGMQSEVRKLTQASKAYQSELEEMRRSSKAHLSELSQTFQKQMTEQEERHKADREEMMGVNRALRLELEQLRTERQRQTVDTEMNKESTSAGPEETIDDSHKQVQLFQPSTNQSIGDLSTAMTRPTQPSFFRPHFQPPPMPFFSRGPPPSIFGGHPPSSFGGYPPFGPSSMIPFHHPAGLLSSFAPPSMGFGPRPSPFGFPSTMSSMFQPPRHVPSFGGFTDDMGLGAGSVLSNLQSKLSMAMKQARKEDDDMTTASVVENDGTEATGFFRRSEKGFSMGQGFKFGNGTMSTMSSFTRV